MSDTQKAVFLSYASQDAEAAKKICEALRAAGIEVWFDQSELVGGDQWDAKIRGQISSCALFMPVISANTQARKEGYFRIEWRLAAQRTHAMSDDASFLMPVVVDDTGDAEARVPAEFKSVQWTKLRGGETPPMFAARVKQLLSDSGSEGVQSGPAERGAASRTNSPEPRTNGPRLRRLWWLLPIFGMSMALVLVFKESKREPAALPSIHGVAAPTQAAKTIARVTAMLGGIDVTRTELDLAGGLLEQAVQSDPGDARLFATWAMLDCRYLTEYYDRSLARRDAAQRHAAQAASLDGADPLVRLACAVTMHEINDNPATRIEAAALLESVRTELPGNPQVLQQLGWAVAWTENGQAAAEGWWAEQAKLPGQAAAAAFNRGLRGAWSGDFRAGYAAMAEADSLGKSTKVKLWKSYLEVVWLGDLAAARRTMAEVPVEAFVEDMPATARYFVAYWSRDYELALTATRAVPREFLQSIAGMSPTGYIRGMVLARLGRATAAENEWRAALAATERRLAADPNDHSLLLSKGLLLVALGDKPAAAQVRRIAIELHGESVGEWAEDDLAAEVLPPEEAISRLQDHVRRDTGWKITAAVLRLNPYYDRFRENPRFVALQAEADADPRLSPTAKAASAPSPISPLPTSSNPLPVDAKSVAVLAFANLSDDKANEYFSDGISEELLNVLAKVPGLKVTARTSSFHFKGKDTPIPEIAQQLGVAYVIEGSVRKQGDKVRITAQLIKAADGFHVWSDTFTRDLKDIFAVQDEIAGLVAQQLQLKLGVTKPARVVDPEAHRLLLEARHYWHLRGEQNFDRTEALLHRALAIDPDFAPAHAAMADLWVMRAAYRTTEGADVSEELRLLRTSAARALQLDSSLAAPTAAMAYGLLIEGRMPAAQQQFEAAVALSPNDPTVRFWQAIFLMQNGDFAAARREFAQARELDPKAWIITHLSGQNALELGRKDEALALLRQANADRPDGFAPAVGYESLALWQSGRTEEAVAAARAVRQSWPTQPRWQADAHAIWVLRQAGLTKEAAAYADALFAGLPAQTYQRGFVLAALGRFDEALPYLERTTTLALDPFASLVIFDPWRDDPRFTALIEQLHWTKPYARAQEAIRQAAAEAKK